MGSTAPHVNVSTIRNFTLALPSRDEQDDIVDFITAATNGLVRTIEDAHREIALLREYRTRLIADVVTGKLDVREAAARLPVETEEPEPLDEVEAETGVEEEEAEVTPEEVAG